MPLSEKSKKLGSNAIAGARRNPCPMQQSARTEKGQGTIKPIAGQRVEAKRGKALGVREAKGRKRGQKWQR